MMMDHNMNAEELMCDICTGAEKGHKILEKLQNLQRSAV